MRRGVFLARLDDEQRRIFMEIFEGKSGPRVASCLGMAPAKVERIIRKTCRQLGTEGRREAAAIIAQHYGWTKKTAATPTRHKSTGAIHFGSKNLKEGMVLVRKNREMFRHHPYLSEIGGHRFFAEGCTDMLVSFIRMVNFSKYISMYHCGQVIVMILVISFASALTLSVLVSAMQNFELITMP